MTTACCSPVWGSSPSSSSGMIVSGAAIYNQEQQEHGSQEQVSVVGVPHHRRLRRGDVRELGVRVPSDGHVRRADRLPVPEGFVGVEAAGRAGPAGRGPARGTRTGRDAVAGAPAAVGCCALRDTRWPIAFFVLFFASWALHAVGGAKAFSEEQVQHGEAADLGVALPDDVAVLVRVDAELAERVHRGRGDRRALNLLAAAGFRGVQAGR